LTSTVSIKEILTDLFHTSSDKVQDKISMYMNEPNVMLTEVQEYCSKHKSCSTCSFSTSEDDAYFVCEVMTFSETDTARVIRK